MEQVSRVSGYSLVLPTALAFFHRAFAAAAKPGSPGCAPFSLGSFILGTSRVRELSLRQPMPHSTPAQLSQQSRAFGFGSWRGNVRSARVSGKGVLWRSIKWTLAASPANTAGQSGYYRLPTEGDKCRERVWACEPFPPLGEQRDGVMPFFHRPSVQGDTGDLPRRFVVDQFTQFITRNSFCFRKTQRQWLR